MRSINTAVVALLPVGGLLFIGAGLLGAGTLKDLGLVLFVGMLAAVYSSIFFATPVLVDLKEREPKFKLHKQRVLARRAAGSRASASRPRPCLGRTVRPPRPRRQRRAGRGRDYAPRRRPAAAAQATGLEARRQAGGRRRRPSGGGRSGGGRSGGAKRR